MIERRAFLQAVIAACAPVGFPLPEPEAVARWCESLEQAAAARRDGDQLGRFMLVIAGPGEIWADGHLVVKLERGQMLQLNVPVALSTSEIEVRGDCSAIVWDADQQGFEYCRAGEIARGRAA